MYFYEGVLRGRRLREGTTVGFVGLGRMGAAMATNLAADGRRVIAYVRRPDEMKDLAARGLGRGRPP